MVPYNLISMTLSFVSGVKGRAYHSLGSESANLLDGAGSTLLERDTVHLFVEKKREKLVFRPKCLVF